MRRGDIKSTFCENKRKAGRIPSFERRLHAEMECAESLVQLDVSNAKSPLVSFETAEAVSPQAHGTPTRAHRRIGLRACVPTSAEKTRR
jgi:hypothetical protein